MLSPISPCRYLTDLVDKNKQNRPWRSANLDATESMDADLEETRGDDCEGAAAALSSLIYSIVKGQRCGNRVHDATRDVLRYFAVASDSCFVYVYIIDVTRRCWLPMVSLGQARRTENGDPNMAQYNTKDGMNAHSWLMLLSTSAAKCVVALSIQNTLCFSHVFVHNQVRHDDAVPQGRFRKARPGDHAQPVAQRPAGGKL